MVFGSVGSGRVAAVGGWAGWGVVVRAATVMGPAW